VGKGSAKSIPIILFVVLVWDAMVAGALGIVQKYGTKTLPQSDELWVLHDGGTGIHFQWLWKTWAEHRIPLAKLLWKGVLQLSGYNFRAGDFLTIGLLAAAALAMIGAAGWIRGRLIVADAFFPLAVLNFGQAQVFLWWWQVNHVLAPVVASAILIVLVLRGNNLQLRDAALIGIGLMVLALCGPGGLPYVVVFAAWLIAWGVAKWPSFHESQRRRALWSTSFVLVALALVVFYFINYTPYFPANDSPSVSEWPSSPGPVASVLAGLQILALSLGTATESHAALWGIAVLVFGIATIALLIRRSLMDPSERWRALGFVALLGAAAILVFMIALSRAGMGLDYIYQGHYLTILVPALCCAYFAWEFRGGRGSRFVQLGMMLVLAFILPFNIRRAMQTGRELEQETAAFERDVRKGIPPSVLAEHHFASDVVPRADQIARIIREHKANGIGIFEEIRDDPDYRIEPVSLDSAILDRAVVENGVVASTPDSQGKSSMTFTLAGPQHVYAVRLRYAYVKTGNLWPAMRIYWRDSPLQDFKDSFVSTVSGPDQPTWALIDGKIHTNAKVRTERTLTVWIDDEIDQFRIYPDTVPCQLRLASIDLLEENN
jgi:hypothetical protein